MWDSDHSNYATLDNECQTASLSQCSDSMGAQPLQQRFSPSDIDVGASRMPSPATRSTQTQLPLSGDDATGGVTVPLPPRSLEVGEADSFAACAWTTAVQAAVRGPALLATGRGDEPGREAESRRCQDSREPGRGVRHRHCHAAVQLPRPGWLVAEPTGIGRSRGRASSRPLSAVCGGGERHPHREHGSEQSGKEIEHGGGL